jgi:hypothetical protein
MQVISGADAEVMVHALGLQSRIYYNTAQNFIKMLCLSPRGVRFSFSIHPREADSLEE